MAVVKKYKAEVVTIINPVDDIFTVEFKSLSGQFRYLPGQFMHLALDEYDPSFGWPESRCYSMQSSPDDEFIKITFSLKGRFTSRMVEELVAGRTVNLKLPYGELFQQDHSRENVIFIAGGTGITPFLSAFNDSTFAGYRNPKLYFGIREPAYNIYESYLYAAKIINPMLKIIIRYQNVDGNLDIDRIINENKVATTYFISGPQEMISVFKARLLAAGLKESLIKTDEWK